MKRLFFALIVITAIFVTACERQGTETKTEMSEEDIMATAKKIHDEVITLDTHDDIDTKNFTDEKNYKEDVDSQVNLPKMKKGGLDVAWFIVYTGQDELNEEGYKKAYQNAIDKFDAIDRLVTKYAPDEIELAKTSDDVRRIHESGKLVAMIGVENAYPVGTDLGRIKDFAERGARYMSLAHNGHSQFSDSNTEENKENPDKPLHNGLSEAGKKAVGEMNKWGIIVDISHPSKAAIKQMIELSKAPVIASHSASRALADHSRNLSDDQLEMVKKNGGVVQTVALNSYLKVDKAKKRSDEERKILEEMAAEENFTLYKDRSEIREKLSEKEQKEYFEKFTALRKKAEPEFEKRLAESSPEVDVKDFVDHIDYLVKKIGIEHVGISSDFDGGGGIKGWKDASETLNVTVELVRRGYTKEQIAKIWSGNMLRVLDEVQKVAKELQSSS